MLCYLYFMYGSTNLRITLLLVSHSQQVLFLPPDTLWMLNCQYLRWLIYFGICFSFHFGHLRSVSVEMISRLWGTCYFQHRWLQRFFFFLFLRLCFPCKAKSPDFILGFSELKREYNRFSATHSYANDYTPLPLSQLITLLLISSRVIEKPFVAFPAPKLAAYVCTWVLCPLLLQKALTTPVHRHLYHWYTGPAQATYSRTLLLQWLPSP